MTGENAQREIDCLRKALGQIARLGGAFVKTSDAEGYDGDRVHARLGAAIADTMAKTAARTLAGPERR